jgi:hypothetical protein
MGITFFAKLTLAVEDCTPGTVFADVEAGNTGWVGTTGLDAQAVMMRVIKASPTINSFFILYPFS